MTDKRRREANSSHRQSCEAEMITETGRTWHTRRLRFSLSMQNDDFTEEKLLALNLFDFDVPSDLFQGSDEWTDLEALILPGKQFRSLGISIKLPPLRLLCITNTKLEIKSGEVKEAKQGGNTAGKLHGIVASRSSNEEKQPLNEGRCHYPECPKKDLASTSELDLPLSQNFPCFPSSLSHLTLVDQGIESLPDSVLPRSLTQLNVSFNRLRALPTILLQSGKLKHLDCSANRLENLPDEIGDLKQLIYLDCSKNQIRHIPQTITKLQQLTSFDCSSNHLSSLPNQLGRMKNLQNLDFSGNEIDHLPHSACYLHKLKHLKMQYNHSVLSGPAFSSHRSSIFNCCEKLSRLNLQYSRSLHPKLNTISLPVDGLPRLRIIVNKNGEDPAWSLRNEQKVLKVEMNTRFSEEKVTRCSHIATELLETVQLKARDKDSSESVGLVRLQLGMPSDSGPDRHSGSLVLRGRAGSREPFRQAVETGEVYAVDFSFSESLTTAAGIPIPTLLKALSFCGNHKGKEHQSHLGCRSRNSPFDIESVCSGLSRFASLFQLALHSLCLEVVPECVCYIHSLQLLDLAENQLHSLPQAMKQLQRLTALDITHNQIELLPMWVAQLDHFFCQGNPLSSQQVPGNILKLGDEHVLKYFKALDKTGSLNSRGLMVALLGETDSGKVSVVKSLNEGLSESSQPKDKKGTRGRSLSIVNATGLDCYFLHEAILLGPAVVVLTADLSNAQQNLKELYQTVMSCCQGNIEIVLVGTHLNEYTDDELDGCCKKLQDNIFNFDHSYRAQLRSIQKEQDLGLMSSGHIKMEGKNAPQYIQGHRAECNLPECPSEVIRISPSSSQGHDRLYDVVEERALKLLGDSEQVLPPLWLVLQEWLSLVKITKDDPGIKIELPMISVHDVLAMFPQESFGSSYPLAVRGICQALDYLASIAHILYFVDTPVLQQTIFLSPESLANFISTFYLSSRSYPRIWQGSELQGHVDLFLKRGVLSKVLIKQLWLECTEYMPHDSEPSSQMIDLLCELIERLGLGHHTHVPALDNVSNISSDSHSHASYEEGLYMSLYAPLQGSVMPSEVENRVQMVSHQDRMNVILNYCFDVNLLKGLWDGFIAQLSPLLFRVWLWKDGACGIVNEEGTTFVIARYFNGGHLQHHDESWSVTLHVCSSVDDAAWNFLLQCAFEVEALISERPGLPVTRSVACQHCIKQQLAKGNLDLALESLAPFYVPNWFVTDSTNWPMERCCPYEGGRFSDRSKRLQKINPSKDQVENAKQHGISRGKLRRSSRDHAATLLSQQQRSGLYFIRGMPRLFFKLRAHMLVAKHMTTNYKDEWLALLETGKDALDEFSDARTSRFDYFLEAAHAEIKTLLARIPELSERLSCMDIPEKLCTCPVESPSYGWCLVDRVLSLDDWHPHTSKFLNLLKETGHKELANLLEPLVICPKPEDLMLLAPQPEDQRLDGNMLSAGFSSPATMEKSLLEFIRSPPVKWQPSFIPGIGHAMEDARADTHANDHKEHPSMLDLDIESGFLRSPSPVGITPTNPCQSAFGDADADQHPKKHTEHPSNLGSDIQRSSPKSPAPPNEATPPSSRQPVLEEAHVNKHLDDLRGHTSSLSSDVKRSSMKSPSPPANDETTPPSSYQSDVELLPSSQESSSSKPSEQRNMWKYIVFRNLADFEDALDPQDICMQCRKTDLLNRFQFKELERMLTDRCYSDKKINHSLLKMLRSTGSDGYEQFKHILRPDPNYTRLLQSISQWEIEARFYKKQSAFEHVLGQHSSQSGAQSSRDITHVSSQDKEYLPGAQAARLAGARQQLVHSSQQGRIDASDSVSVAALPEDAQDALLSEEAFPWQHTIACPMEPLHGAWAHVVHPYSSSPLQAVRGPRRSSHFSPPVYSATEWAHLQQDVMHRQRAGPPEQRPQTFHPTYSPSINVPKKHAQPQSASTQCSSSGQPPFYASGMVSTTPPLTAAGTPIRYAPSRMSVSSQDSVDTNASSGASHGDVFGVNLQRWDTQEIMPTHMLQLAETAAVSKWAAIARRLLYHETGGEAFSQNEIEAIRKNNADVDKECFRQMIQDWINMSVNHTVGALYDALVSEKLARPAQETFGRRPS